MGRGGEEGKVREISYSPPAIPGSTTVLWPVEAPFCRALFSQTC